MSDRTGNDGEDSGGMPVGRLASGHAGGAGRPGRPTGTRGLSSALPLISLALVAGLGIGLAIGLLINRGDTPEAATTTIPAESSTTSAPDGSSTSTSAGTDPATP